MAAPEFRVFESEEQKQQRMMKFWREEIEGYYKREVGAEEEQLLASLLEE